jgi:hypothetical protein
MKNAYRIIVTGIALCTVALTAVAAKSPFKGTLNAAETVVVAFPFATIDGTGQGVASQLGQFTMTYHVEVNLLTASGPASITLVAANGDTVTAEGTGSADDQGTVLFITEDYTVTGGTGRFANASGNFTIERVYDPISSTSTGRIEGSLII